MECPIERHFCFMELGATVEFAEDVRFSSESWHALSLVEKRLTERVLNLLEDRMRKEGRGLITKEDVKACIKDAMQEILDELSNELVEG